jgi:hypothetical protein
MILPREVVGEYVARAWRDSLPTHFEAKSKRLPVRHPGAEAACAGHR